MYDSRTYKPVVSGGQSHHYAEMRYRGKGNWISDDTPLHVAVRVEMFTDANAIAEGLVEYLDEREDQAYQDYLDCEVMDWSAMGWDDLEDYGDVSLEDVLEAESVSESSGWDDDRLYDCDGPGMCHICTPGIEY